MVLCRPASYGMEWQLLRHKTHSPWRNEKEREERALVDQAGNGTARRAISDWIEHFSARPAGRRTNRGMLDRAIAS